MNDDSIGANIKEMVERQDNFKPMAALTIYQSTAEKRASYGMPKSKIYVEMHQIDERGNILAGKPLTEDFASQLGKSLFSQSQVLTSGMIPSNLLYIGWKHDMPVLVWHTEPQKVTAYYTRELHIADSAKINAPRLVWKFSLAHTHLWIYAAKGYDPGEPLYHAPFHNVHGDGSVCLGTGKLDRSLTGTFKGIMDAAEKLFWKTRFSAVHNNRGFSSNLNALHKSLATGAEFPTEGLVSFRDKISSLCK